jgi:CheY-like chemotaxis protein
MMRENKSILLVEDDEIDAMTVRRAMMEIKVTNPLDIAEDGEQALEYLRNSEIKLPGLILLDLNIPRMGGIEFLRVVKRDETLKKIPVVVLTTSSEDRDRIDAYDLSVAGYIVKPVNYLNFVEAVRTIDLYWTLCELPPGV